MQQTFLNMHRARGRFEPGADPCRGRSRSRAGLFLDSNRRGKRGVIARDDDDERSMFDCSALDARQDELVDGATLAVVIDAALADLPENQRSAFELIKRDGLSVAEAAGVLGTTLGAVKLRAHRAYQALRDALGRRETPAARTVEGRGRHEEGRRRDDDDRSLVELRARILAAAAAAKSPTRAEVRRRVLGVAAISVALSSVLFISLGGVCSGRVRRRSSSWAIAWGSRSPSSRGSCSAAAGSASARRRRSRARRRRRRRYRV